MDEPRNPRARRITTPLSTNTGPLASAAWLAGIGLVPAEPRWFVEIALRAATQAARFQLDIYAEEWGFQVDHGGRASWIRVTDVAFVHGRDDHGLLARTPKLAEIGALVRELETRFAVRFDRDQPVIHSSIADAQAAVRAWIASL